MEFENTPLVGMLGGWCHPEAEPAAWFSDGFRASN